MRGVMRKRARTETGEVRASHQGAHTHAAPFSRGCDGCQHGQEPRTMAVHTLAP